MVSADVDGKPLPWMAISGTVADKTTAGKLYAVTDSASAEARILTIDATQTPAVITAAITVTKDGAPATLLVSRASRFPPTAASGLPPRATPSARRTRPSRCWSGRCLGQGSRGDRPAGSAQGFGHPLRL
jgi:hypothetical protein